MRFYVMDLKKELWFLHKFEIAMPFICHIWEALMRLLNTPEGREIVEAYPIRSPVIHVLHVLHVPRMLSLEYRMRVSTSNFSGHSLPTLSYWYNFFRHPSLALFFYLSISRITLSKYTLSLFLLLYSSFLI